MSEALRLAEELLTGYPLAPDAIAGAMELRQELDALKRRP